MKKLLTVAITLLLGATLSLAQDTGGDKKLNPQPLPPGKKATATSKTKTKSGKKATKGKKDTITTDSHKGGKKDISPTVTPDAKSTKGSSTTTPPK